MMNGTFAVLTLALGLWDMAANYCPNEGCLADRQGQSRTSLSAGSLLFQDDTVANEIYIRKDTGTFRGPYELTYGLSTTTEGSTWAGIGASWTRENWSRTAYVQLHAMPGIYLHGDGPDLGGPIEFRSGIEAGLQTRSGARFGISYDHRSNADIYDDNPGMETIQLRVSIPTN